MQLLLVIDGMHPRDGGPPQVVAGSAIALAQRGHTVTVLTSVLPGDNAAVEQAWDMLKAVNINVVMVNPIDIRAMIGLRQLPQAVYGAISAADYVHLHGIWSPFLLLVAKTCRKMSRKYAVSVHGLLDQWSIQQSALKKRMAVALAGVKGYLNGAEAVIFGTEGEARDAHYLSAKVNQTVVANGAVLPSGPAIVTDAQRARLNSAAPSSSNWKRRILFFSRLHPKKGPDLLLTAFEEIAADYPDTGLIIAGIAEDEDYEVQLRKTADQSPASGQIAVTTSLTGRESRFLFNKCDLFVLPSHQEGFSMAILEAMAHKMPVLITHPCRLPEVESMGAGRCVAPDSPSIAAGLRSLLDLNETNLKKLGQAAEKMIADQYSWSKIAVALEQIYSGSKAHSL